MAKQSMRHGLKKGKAAFELRSSHHVSSNENSSINRFSLDTCQIVNLPKLTDPRGNLTFIEGENHIPFNIKRVYYLYDVPGGAERGGHAHRELHQLIIAMSGSFDIVLNDGFETKRFHLCRSYYGLYVCPMIWRSIDNFSSGSVCLVLASNLYDESDYYRTFDDFKNDVDKAPLC